MPEKTFKGVFASSADPTGRTLSLTIESLSKVIIGVLGYFTLSNVGFDVNAATTQLEAITALTVQLIPMAFALWNGCLVLFGLVRKLLNVFKSEPSEAQIGAMEQMRGVYIPPTE